MGSGDSNFEDELKGTSTGDKSQVARFNEMRNNARQAPLQSSGDDASLADRWKEMRNGMQQNSEQVVEEKTTEPTPSLADRFKQMRKEAGWADRISDERTNRPERTR